MRDTVEVVGVNIDNVTMDEAAEILAEYLDTDIYSMVFTPNSEILLEAVKKRELEEALNSGQLVIPDGIGVVIASRFYGTPVKEKVPGVELVMRLMEAADLRGKSVYILGGKPGVAEEAAIRLKEKFSKLRIAGARDGYFYDEDEAGIIEEINSSCADILLVALGAPKQEYFIHKHKNDLKVKIAMGVGGSVDVIAGRAKRAPEFYQKAGLEWLYRLMKEPRRIGRIMRLPKFMILAFFDARFR